MTNNYIKNIWEQFLVLTEVIASIYGEKKKILETDINFS